MDNRLIAYSSNRREIDGEERTFRTRIGVAFPHKRAEGYTILNNDSISIAGEIVLFPPFDDGAAPPATATRARARPLGPSLPQAPTTASATSPATSRSSGPPSSTGASARSLLSARTRRLDTFPPSARPAASALPCNRPPLLARPEPLLSERVAASAAPTVAPPAAAAAFAPFFIFLLLLLGWCQLPNRRDRFPAPAKCGLPNFQAKKRGIV